MTEMNASCKIAMSAFCRLNGWDYDSIRVFLVADGVYHLQIRNEISDLDDFKIIPDEYHIGANYTGNYTSFNIFEEDRLLCVLYPPMPD